MAKTALKTIIRNDNIIDGMQKRRNSSIVTIVGQEHHATNGTAYFAMSPDMVIISELRFKIIGTAGFSSVTLDNALTMAWSGGAGVAPSAGPNDFFDLLAAVSGTSFATSLFNGGVHSLTVNGAGDYRILMYAKYSARNR